MANIISMADFAMSAGRKQAMIVPPEYALAVRDFLDLFELVFGDGDWPVTLANLQYDPGFLIHPNGTFIEPGVANESSNWHNRGSLLAAYRRLKTVCAGKNFNVVEIHPCGAVTRQRPTKPEPDVI